MNKKCIACEQNTMVSNAHTMAMGGIMLIILPIALIIGALLTIVGVIAIPVIVILWPFFALAGVIVLICSPFVNGARCSKCGAQTVK